METVKKIIGHQGFGGGRDMNRRNTGNVYASEIILKDTIIYTCHYTFVKTHRMNNTRVKLSVNYRLWLILMCPYWYLDCNKCTIPRGDVDGGEAVCGKGRDM